jgi:hypothetical protein
VTVRTVTGPEQLELLLYQALMESRPTGPAPAYRATLRQLRARTEVLQGRDGN